ncbi:AzlC family ABC transporter permease [Treponema sp. OMZ 840]|uniref:AzlC family ABC transporter permease n=1 Tax=Treponema sp. OMZ 840 TaxID=244313 RepID=UPI003D907AA5
MNRGLFFKAMQVTAPVFFGYIAIGIPFGLMLTQAGYPWYLAPLMSIIMYAGAGQYAAVGLFAAGASLPLIALTTLAVNIRHIVYGLSLSEQFKDTGIWKPYLIFALTDETYALLTSTSVPPQLHKDRWYAAIAVLNHSYWILGSSLGALLGVWIPFSFKGVDFALTALFIVLLIDRLKLSKNPLPALIGAASASAALIVFKPGNMLIASLVLGTVFLILLKKPVEHRGKFKTNV